MYNSSRKATLDTPNLKAIMMEVENKYRTIYRITDPDFSVVKLMQDICKKNSKMAAGDEHNQQLSNTNDSAVVHHDAPSEVHGCRSKAVMKNLQDITRGEEGVQIPLLNDDGAMELPNFFYISKNIVFKDAYVSFSLARISDESYCSQCVGDCLSSEIPCACAGETRGEFAYTKGGYLKETFLQEAITMSRKPKRKHFYYCENCPLENNHCKAQKKDAMQGTPYEEVHQRMLGQVFSTPEGKGWGLRPVHALKKGTFVCEYVGEIVTNHELHLRNNQRTGDEEHTYPVLLDADWGSERVLKDEEALCLDATKYGNCGRFINHRCVDSTLVEIPVEIEIPDHHYYHV
ncbi:Detected protein of unknown function [Hibiscus syriacus]|uniref:SET domain-containing protein n=1 Tax=Hibiscus syriacus TaxID=106335 RepID=A0A6A3CQI6_HIBSY|nr:Detected protein of unknown function [Hibiscus syriacus]